MNDQAIEDDAGLAGGGKMRSQAQLQELLVKRERRMQEGGATDEPTDQWRVYCYIRDAIKNQNGSYLRLMVQASAGTGAPSSCLAPRDTTCVLRTRRMRLRG